MVTSCTKDLERTSPNGLTAKHFIRMKPRYKASLAKICGGLSLTGSSGPDGSGDLSGN